MRGSIVTPGSSVRSMNPVMKAEFPQGNDLPDISRPIRHLYIHIPFCARICPYCAFYKDLVDRSETHRFCKAIVSEVAQQAAEFNLVPETIFFGGGTPT